MNDYTELKRLAEAAVGKTYSSGEKFFFSAEATPEQVLALIAENDSSRKHWQNESNNVQALMVEVARLKAENAGLQTGYEAYERVNAQLKAEVEKLRKERDARHPFKPFHEPSIGFTGCVICGVYTDHGGLPCPRTRATADAAMGQGEQS